MLNDDLYAVWMKLSPTGSVKGFVSDRGFHFFSVDELVRFTVIATRVGVNVLDMGQPFVSTTGNYVLPFVR